MSKKNLLQPIFDSTSDISLTKAEIICQSLNMEFEPLGLGFECYTSPDKTAVYINDETICRVVEFLKNKRPEVSITKQQLQNMATIKEIANVNNVDIIWEQIGFRRRYYYAKQYGFNGFNLYNVLSLNTVNTVSSSVSTTGAATLSMAGVVALSWTGSLFLSTLENYIPNSMPRIKIAVSGAKYVTALPIRLVEWTSNSIFGFVEGICTGNTLPTNVTETYNLNVGPKIKHVKTVTKPFVEWLIQKLQGFKD